MPPQDTFVRQDIAIVAHFKLKSYMVETLRIGRGCFERCLTYAVGTEPRAWRDHVHMVPASIVREGGMSSS